MNELQKLLTEYIEKQRKLYRDEPFLSDYENGVNTGVNDTLDGIEQILKDIKKHDKEKK